jgi:hypothetical protein
MKERYESEEKKIRNERMENEKNRTKIKKCKKKEKFCHFYVQHTEERRKEEDAKKRL